MLEPFRPSTPDQFPGTGLFNYRFFFAGLLFCNFLFHRGFGFGYTTYVPYVETVYTHWLEMRLYGPGGTTKGKIPLWIGEAAVGMEDPETRQAVNYLLVGVMEYFGADTAQWVTVTLKKNDPRVLALAETP